MRAIAIFVLWFAGSAYATAPDAPVISGEIVEEGLAIVVGTLEDEEAPDTAAGRTSTHDEIQFVRKTNVIPAKLGTVFGIRYRLAGLPTHGILSFEMRTTHPPMRGPDGQERTVSTSQFPVESSDGRYEDDLVYLLSEPFEVLPGKWVLQILYQGRQVVSREFNLQ